MWSEKLLPGGKHQDVLAALDQLLNLDVRLVHGLSVILVFFRHLINYRWYRPQLNRRAQPHLAHLMSLNIFYCEMESCFM